jgi:hypothetical protein
VNRSRKEEDVQRVRARSFLDKTSKLTAKLLRTCSVKDEWRWNDLVVCPSRSSPLACVPHSRCATAVTASVLLCWDPAAATTSIVSACPSGLFSRTVASKLPSSPCTHGTSQAVAGASETKVGGGREVVRPGTLALRRTWIYVPVFADTTDFSFTVTVRSLV